MSELYLMATISDRNQSRRFLAFYKEYGISVTFLTLGRGTAASEVLDAFGLEASEKAVQFAVVTATEWKKVKKPVFLATILATIFIGVMTCTLYKKGTGTGDQDRYSGNGDRLCDSPEQHRRKAAASLFDRGPWI